MGFPADSHVHTLTEKMTAIMLSVLATLVTNDINTVNRVKSDTDGERAAASRLQPQLDQVLT